MKFIEHNFNNTKAIEIVSEDVLINSEQDALDIMANVDYQHNCRKLIVYKKNICDDFFDLKTGIAGSVLQKFSNYRVQLAIIGDFTNINSKSLNDFIYESNKNKQVLFLKDVSTAIKKLC
ncbi:DUF4180 domain-containing protein [Bacteroidota bacterium]